MTEDMRRDISELKHAVESTNASLKQVVESLNATNAAVVSVTARLDNTNAKLNSTNAELGTTNAKLNNTNAELGTTNAKLHRTMISVAQVVGDMADIKDYLAENIATKKDMSDLNSRMDGFSGLLLDSRHRWAVHAETLANHDERIKKLETPA